jgi:hypothetical protein
MNRQAPAHRTSSDPMHIEIDARALDEEFSCGESGLLRALQSGV